MQDYKVMFFNHDYHSGVLEIEAGSALEAIEFLLIDTETIPNMFAGKAQASSGQGYSIIIDVTKTKF